MALQDILKASKDFYKSHQLEAWAKALPSSTKLNKEAESAVTRAEELGLEQAMAFPDFKTQMAAIATVIAETAMQPVPGIPANPKFAKVYISDDWAKEPSGRVYQARRECYRRCAVITLTHQNQNFGKEKARGRKILAVVGGVLLGGIVVFAVESISDSHLRLAMIVGAVLLFFGIMNLVMIPHPLWFAVLSLIVFLPAAYLGAKLAASRQQAAMTHAA